MTDEKWAQVCMAVDSLTATMAKMLAAEAQRSAEINQVLGRLNLVTTKISTDLDRILVAIRQPVLEITEPDWCPSGNHPAGDCECPTPTD